MDQSDYVKIKGFFWLSDEYHRQCYLRDDKQGEDIYHVENQQHVNIR